MTDLKFRVSPNGEEFFDWAHRLSEHIHKHDRLRQIKNDLARVGRECGDCSKWMKNSCPHEQNIDGHKRGPSCGSSICSQFAESSSSAERRAKLTAELSATLNSG